MVFGVGPHQARHANRGDAKGQGALLSHQGCGQVGLEFAMQNGGHQAHAIKRRAIAAACPLVTSAAVQIFPNEFRDSLLCAVAQITEGGIAAVQIHALDYEHGGVKLQAVEFANALAVGDSELRI